MLIVHIVTNDKFTHGYIDYLKHSFSSYEQYFLVSAWSCSNDVSLWNRENFDFENVIKYDRLWDLLFDKKIRRLLSEANKIIVSGIFGIEKVYFYFPRAIFEKTYWQFWGGDLRKYNFLQSNGLSESIMRHKFISCLRKIRCCVFLSKTEYSSFYKMYGIEKRWIVAGVPHGQNEEWDDYSVFNDDGYIAGQRPVRVLVGNSATKDNDHISVFNELSKYKDENIEIYCPIVYGDENYKSRIKEVGQTIFGARFIPVTDWMNLYDYYCFLGKCDIGIFAMERQQALGNITPMFKMGKKVYLKKKGQNFKHFSDMFGFSIHCFEDIKGESFLTFSTQSLDEKMTNIEIGKKFNVMENYKQEWGILLSD
ncbi:TDP-N-acetylfucosamine:lipid II N-acetylfucosaminyltransferase [Butyrivibrio proteoclasticus]|uniref:TDP-N-acetylfucosamine:lipid II N-acetylfucosaminyltransferase n=1 Tax=Butyrivibrio proteoclasticus TaxID=43305 RepID=UPI00047C43C1|nr:TDP-N-acetylfucosamine:lipid II N-acetylfucosaminyltransferase [Butyrivibrio proteoclasticus]